jgi:hypothetical protein
MRFLPLVLILAAGCQRPAALPTTAAGSKSPAGWEIRYNAVLALLRRGSTEITQADLWDIVMEMLDEDQQLRNFRTKDEDGREVVDENGARTTVIGTLQALQELHRKQPKIDLFSANEAIEKLLRSLNPTVRVQARQAQLVLFNES